MFQKGHSSEISVWSVYDVWYTLQTCLAGMFLLSVLGNYRRWFFVLCFKSYLYIYMYYYFSYIFFSVKGKGKVVPVLN